MINVTVGEQKTQEKPFPKLMISDLGQIIYAMGINRETNNNIIGFLIHSNGYEIGSDNFTKMWTNDFVDYNEPITLQNA